MAVSMYGRNASVRTPHAGGGAGTSRTEPKGMGAGGPQRVAAWDGARGGADATERVPPVGPMGGGRAGACPSLKAKT